MFRNLCAEALGISGRQSELIELALTHGFRGLNLDIAELARRVESHGAEHTFRFIKSANIKIGEFELPVRWQADELEYKADIAELGKIVEVAKSMDAQRFYTTVPAATDHSPFNEYFEQTRKRIGEIAAILEPHGIRLGLTFNAAASHREGLQFEFIHQAEALMTLIKTIGGTTVGLALDLWNWKVGGGGIDQLRALSGDQFITVRVADVPDGAELATIDQSQRLLPGESENSDVAPLLAHLGEQEYDGPITIYPDPSQLGGLTREALIRKVTSALDEQWKAAGLTKAGKIAEAEEPAEEATAAADA